MRIETAITKIGTKIFKQAERAYVKPACEIRAFGSIESKLKPLADDVVEIGNKTKSLQTLPIKPQRQLISEADFKKQMLSLRLGGYGADKKFMESAKIGEGLFDKGYIDSYKALQQYARRDGELILDYDYIPRIMDFIKTKDGFSANMQNKIIEFLKTCHKKYAKSIPNLSIYNKQSPLVKEKILDLNIKIHNEFDDIGYASNEWFADNFTEALARYVNKELPEKEILKRLEKLSYIADNSRKISPFSELIDSAAPNIYLSKEWIAEQNKIVQKFLDLNIIPTEHAVEQVTKGSFEAKNKFFHIMQPLIDLKVAGIKVDEYAIENILKSNDKTVLNDIIKLIKSNKNYKDSRIDILENSLNPKEYQISLRSKDKNLYYIFDKKTHKMTSRDKMNFGNILTASSENIALKREVKGLNRRYRDGSVIDETIVQKTRVGNQKYTEYTKESSMEGQLDVYRILPSGNIKVLGKSFRDPITGEAIIRRNFKSPNGAKVSYNYNADKSGNYDFDYIIKNKKGEVIMNQKYAQKILGQNHYLSVINGQKYEVKLNKHILTVTPEGQKPVKINLKKMVEDNVNSKIYDTISQLPAEEILNLKKFNVKIVKSLDKENAASRSKGLFDELFGNPRYIEIGDTTAESKFVLLHELGHIKNEKISDVDYEKILKVYKQEVEKIRKSTTQSEQELMAYLIDTEHYLNNGKGAIEELIADANAQKSVITDIHLGDGGIRTIKAQEYLPETLATISEVLAKV